MVFWVVLVIYLVYFCFGFIVVVFCVIKYCFSKYVFMISICVYGIGCLNLFVVIRLLESIKSSMFVISFRKCFWFSSFCRLKVFIVIVMIVVV